jgi:hypothetical protein
VNTKFAYLCSGGCCRLRNTLLVELCTSRDDGVTAGNSLENRFLQNLAGMSANLCLFRTLINFVKSQKWQGAESDE